MSRASFPLIFGPKSLKAPVAEREIKLNLNPSKELEKACWDEYGRIFDNANIIQKSLTDKANGSSDGGLTIFNDRSNITISLFLHAVENFSTYNFSSDKDKQIRDALVNNILVYFANCTPFPGVLDADQSPSVKNTDDDFYMLAMLLIKRADLKSSTDAAAAFALASPNHRAHVTLIDKLIEIAVLGISEKRKKIETNSSNFIGEKVSKIFNGSDSRFCRVVDDFIGSVPSIISRPTQSLEYYKNLSVVNLELRTDAVNVSASHRAIVESKANLDNKHKLEVIRDTISPVSEPLKTAWYNAVTHVANTARKKKHFILQAPPLDFDEMPYVSSVHDFQVKLLSELVVGENPFLTVLVTDDQISPLKIFEVRTWNGFISKLNGAFNDKDERKFDDLLARMDQSDDGSVKHSLDFLRSLFELREKNNIEIKLYDSNSQQFFQSHLNDARDNKIFAYVGSNQNVLKIQDLTSFINDVSVVRQIVGYENIDLRSFDFRKALIYAALNNHAARTMNLSVAIPVTDKFKQMFDRLGLTPVDVIKETSIPFHPNPIPLSDIVISLKNGGDVIATVPHCIGFSGRPVPANPVIAA